MSIISVSRSSAHEFGKLSVPAITLMANLGVEDDCHRGLTVQHRSRLHIKPAPVNLRQVHLIHSELFTEVLEAGFVVKPGELGENITTVGVDLLGLGRGTLLHFLNSGMDIDDEHAVIRLTGLRNPCPQIEKFQKGLQERFIVRDAEGKIVGRKAGVMAIVEASGVIETGARIVVEPAAAFDKMECVLYPFHQPISEHMCLGWMAGRPQICY